MPTALACVICYNRERCILVLPCRQILCCETCVEGLRQHKVKNCPWCRKNIESLQRVIIPHPNKLISQSNCIYCQINRRAVANYPCSHVVSCEACHANSPLQCGECGFAIEDTTVVTIPSE